MSEVPLEGGPSPSQPPTPDRTARWGIADAAAGFVVALVISVVVANVWVGATGERDVTLGLTVVTLLAQWTGLVGAVLLASRRKGTGDLDADFGLRVEGRDLGPGIVAGVLSQLVLIPLLYLPFDLLGADLDVSEKARETTDLGQGSGLFVLAIFIVIGAPVVEELFFRGLLQRAVDRRYGARWAVGVSSVAFGITHFQPVQLLGLVAFGMVLAVLAQRAGRLGPALIAHVAFNATSVAALVATR